VSRTLLILLVAAIGAAVLVGYALGSSGGGEAEERAIDRGLSAPLASDGTPVPGEGSPTRPAPHASIGSPTVWGPVQAAAAEGGDSTEGRSEALTDELDAKSPEAIEAFDAARRQVDRQLYTWDVWGAAYVIEDGCSDDCFRDFRAYLISLGRGPYRTALRNPDGIAPVVEDAETGDWENADNVAPDAYEEVAGEDIPSGDSDLDGEPSGTPWDDEQQDELVRRYARLADRFR
jgi:hypothetical protein